MNGNFVIFVKIGIPHVMREHSADITLDDVNMLGQP